jgi:pimeloyl-ACP methyl ester carboxylesterase
MASLVWTWPRELEAVLSADARFDDLTDLDLPTLVILGELSPEPYRHACRKLADALSNSQLVELPGQGHLAHLDAPEALAAVVADFLDD